MKKQLLYESNVGVYFYKETTGALASVKVQVKRTKRMYTLARYDYPNIPLKLSSPLLSWENLNCCNGWKYDEAYLLTAVQDGKKPYAGCSVFLASTSDIGKAEDDLSVLISNLPDNCTAGKEISRSSRFFYYYICRQGCLKDFFDLEVVIEDYGRMGVSLGEREREELRRNFEVPLSQFGQGDPYPYFNADTTVELITTGLLLGYPIESTFALL